MAVFLEREIRRHLAAEPTRTFRTKELLDRIVREHPDELRDKRVQTYDQLCKLAAIMPDFTKRATSKRNGKNVIVWHWKHNPAAEAYEIEASEGITYTNEFAQTIGLILPDDIVAADAEPQSRLDWALRWAAMGIAVFPAEPFLGDPLVSDWYNDATTTRSKIVSWFKRGDTARRFYPPEIGCVPDRSNPSRFVISANIREGGIESLAAFEEKHGALVDLCEFYHEDEEGSLFYWFRYADTKGVYTSHHKLGRGIHVLGAGQKLFLPPSQMPHLNYDHE